jgi:excinuclease UvrABC nuclease subunit
MEKQAREQRRLLIKSLPRSLGAGVYVLWSDCRVIYIGQSRDVPGRLIEHTSKSFDRIQVVALDDEDKRAILELWLIATIKPELNLQKTDIKSVKRAILKLRLQAYRKQNRREFYESEFGHLISKRGYGVKHLQAFREMRAQPVPL